MYIYELGGKCSYFSEKFYDKNDTVMYTMLKGSDIKNACCI